MVRLHRDLFELLRCYSALAPPKFLTYPSQLRVMDVHNFLLDNILSSKHLVAYPPSDRYRHSFWKWAIHHLEEAVNKALEEDVEIDMHIYEHYVSLLPPPPSVMAQTPPPPPSYVSYFWHFPMVVDQETIEIDSYQITTLLESRTTIERGTTGLRTWLASFVLSQYLISHPEIIAHKRILELGCGAGFLGIVVATIQKLVAPQENYTLWMSDANEEVLERCRNNVQLPCNLSASHSGVRYCPLDWAHAIDPATIPLIQSTLQDVIDSELVLGADIVFDPTLVPALVGTLCLALQASRQSAKKVALVALTLRNEDTFSKFLQAADRFLAVDDLRVQLTDVMFLGMLNGEGGSQEKPDVKILRLSLKEHNDV